MSTKQPPAPQTAAEAVYWIAGAVVQGDQPRKISLTTISVLGLLRRTGPRRITELAAVQGVAQPSMTALVGSLEQAGLVERGQDPTDKRAVLVSVTEAGQELLAERRRDGAERIGRLIDLLAPEEAAALDAAVPALVHLWELHQQAADPVPTPPADPAQTQPAD